MPRKKGSSTEEFEIERINANYQQADQKEIRSLVFKISKRIQKNKANDLNTFSNALQERKDALHEKTSIPSKQIMDTSSANVKDDVAVNIDKIDGTENVEQNINPLKLKLPKSTMELTENKGPELRRTSRRIILRVNKNILEESQANKKTCEIKEDAKKIFPTALRHNSEPINKGKQRRRRKSAPIGIMKKKGIMKRGPGRPRNVDREIKASATSQNIPSSGAKSVKNLTPKQFRSSTVWTLVPKEIVDSDFFKAHIIKMHFPRTPGRKPKAAVLQDQIPSSLMSPRIPFRMKENFDLQIQKIPVIKKPFLHQDQDILQKPANRPTVIYFPKMNCSNTPHDQTGQINPQQRGNSDLHKADFGSRQFWDKSYLRNKYNTAINEIILEYVYGVANGDVQKAEELLSDILSGEKALIEEHSGHYRIVTNPKLLGAIPIISGKENDFEDDGISQNSALKAPDLMSSIVVDTLCRQVIVDSIKLLYDEESVFGYS